MKSYTDNQVHEACCIVESSKNSTSIAKVQYNDFWGFGLNLVQTMYTKLNAWPYENSPGLIIGCVAADLTKRLPSHKKQR